MTENYITCQEDKGTINVSEDVMVAMVRATINEIDGVAALTNNAGAELAELLPGIIAAASRAPAQAARQPRSRHRRYSPPRRCIRCAAIMILSN